MGLYLLQSESVLRVELEDPLDQVLALVADPAGEMEFAGHIRQESLGVLVLERQFPAHHGVEDHSDTPDVRHWAQVRLTDDDLRSSVRVRSAVGLQLLRIPVPSREPKVRYL